MNRVSSARDHGDLVQDLCRSGSETEWIEFKTNFSDPKGIGKYISALANAAALNGQQYGYLLWGVEDRTGRPVGTSFDPNAAKVGNEPLETWLLRLLEPPVHFGFHSVEVCGRRIAYAEIGRATHVPVRFRGVDYVRVGTVRKPLKDVPERERALWRLFDREPFESGIAGRRLGTDEVLEQLAWRTYFDLLHQPRPRNRDGIVEALSSDRLVRRSSGDNWDILNLGAMLLARNLEDFPTLARKAVRVVQYSGAGRSETINEIVGRYGYAAGFVRMIDHLSTLLPGNEVIEKGLRKFVPVFPVIAVRELVANMLIHQDFSIPGTGPMVEIFTDRIEVTNPGVPLIATDRLMDAPPRSRNETMASLMRRFGICEERGSGIDKAMSAIETARLPAPLFETPPGAMRVVMFAHRDLKEMTRADRVRAVYLHSCLHHSVGERTTNATVRRRFGIPERNAAIASRLLNEAMEAGRIVMEDPAAANRNRAYLPFWAAPTGP